MKKSRLSPEDICDDGYCGCGWLCSRLQHHYGPHLCDNCWGDIDSAIRHLESVGDRKAVQPVLDALEKLMKADSVSWYDKKRSNAR